MSNVYYCETVSEQRALAVAVVVVSSQDILLEGEKEFLRGLHDAVPPGPPVGCPLDAPRWD
jgi:hypothetical protein